MLSKSLFQFSVEGQGYVPSLFDLRPNYGGGIEDNGDLLEMSHACTTALSASNHVAGQCQHTPLPVTPGYSEASLGQSLMGSLLLSPGEGNGTPLQYSCLENPMDGGAWWAAVHGVTKSRTRLSEIGRAHV